MARERNGTNTPATGVATALRPKGLARTGPSAEASARVLLVTSDRALVRAFRRELRRCTDCSVFFDVTSNFREARRAGPYGWVTVDLDGAIAPSEAVRLARRSWPSARIAVLSCWWSERDTAAGELADVVIHKPLRSMELRAFLRSPAGAARTEVLSRAKPSGRALRTEPQDETLAVATR